MAQLCFVIVVKKSRVIVNSWPELKEVCFPDGQKLDSKGYKTEPCPVANCELLRISCASLV